jgi:hypothetical protein
MNNPAITGAVVPEGAETQVKMPAPKPPAVASSKGLSNRLFFTGGMFSGKDYIAAACGAQIIGLADPLYALVNTFFSTTVSASEGKGIPGVRELLQTLGQWGRGTVDEKYPLTLIRFLMTERIRATGLPQKLHVNLKTFGSNPDIWIDSLVARAADLDAGKRIAITNVRFENEFKKLQSAGWVHYHIMCSGSTRAERIKKAGLVPSQASLQDTSERMAAVLNASVMDKIKSPTGKMLRVVWNDTAASPSARLFSVAQLVQEVAINQPAK